MSDQAKRAAASGVSTMRSEVADAQLPPPGSINIDHIAHFVPDIDRASGELQRLGFTLTPFSLQSHRLEANGPLVPAGAGNRCIMLERAYLELLTPTADTPIGEQLRHALARYVGVHLIAFGTADASQDHARLEHNGFDPTPPIALQRPIGTETGEDTARFTVVRVAPGTMAEGRVQYCQQMTPHLLWQSRWLRHENGAIGLSAVFVCVADVEEAAARYSRFTGLPARGRGGARAIETARGTVFLVDVQTIERAFSCTPPVLPWIAGYALRSRDLDATRNVIGRTGHRVRSLGGERLIIELPDVLGGIVLFERTDAPPLRFDQAGRLQ